MKTTFRTCQLLLIFYLSSLGQVIERSVAWDCTNSPDTFNLQMMGLVDGDNTFSVTNRSFTRNFEPMKSLSMTNRSNSVIQSPRLVINNRRNWYTVNLLGNEIMAAAADLRNAQFKTLSLWDFIRKNRFHLTPAEAGGEINQATRLLGVYGYGYCDDAASAAVDVARTLGFPARVWGLDGHVVAEVDFGEGWSLVDGDVEVLYRDLDNKRFAGKEEITLDRYLISRTHHYGIHRNDGVDGYLASFYDRSDKQNAEPIRPPHVLDCRLSPGEKITFDYGPALIYHNIYAVGDLPRLSEVANGTFELRTGFEGAPLDRWFASVSNVIRKGGAQPGPALQAFETGKPATTVYRMNSPYALLDADLTVHAYCASSADSLRCYFSKDSLIWSELAVAPAPGYSSTTVNLSALIAPQILPATYQYYLKFAFYPDIATRDCGIDSIGLKSRFQISRFAMPRLTTGSNAVVYSDNNAGTSHPRIEVRWAEDLGSRPPERTVSPLFPADGAVVDSAVFTFRWEPSLPSGNDTIVTYHFMLSELPDVRWPFSPNFDFYTYVFAGATNTFRIPGAGLLNSGTRYYWRVRPRSASGIWGAWSPVWSFMPMTVMRPVNLQAAVHNEFVDLSWNPNPRGAAPTAYDVHASDEAYGFTPRAYTWIKRVGEPRVSLPRAVDRSLHTFYRVTALSPSGEPSAPSEAVSLPFPNVLTRIRPVRTADTFRLYLDPNRSFYPVYHSSFDTVRARVALRVLAVPGWLRLDSARNLLLGCLDSGGVARLDSDSALNTILLELTDSGTAPVLQSLRLRSATPEDDLTGLPGALPGRTLSAGSPVSIAHNASPAEFTYVPGMPNPFNGSTAIRFGLPEGWAVSARILNLSGRTVAELISRHKIPGYTDIRWRPEQVASGVYYLVTSVEPPPGSGLSPRRLCHRLSYVR